MKIITITISKKVWYGLTDQDFEAFCERLAKVYKEKLTEGAQVSVIVQVPDLLFGELDLLIALPRLDLPEQALELLLGRVIEELNKNVPKSLNHVSYVIVLGEVGRSGTL